MNMQGILLYLPSLTTWLIGIVFLSGYVGIILEHYYKVNKAAIALLMAACIWGLQFLSAGMNGTVPFAKSELSAHIGEISELIFFLLGAMTIVEIIDSHKGFQMILNLHSTTSKRKTVCLIALLTFFTAAILDSLATTIVVISLTRRLLRTRADRLLAGGLVVIAANSGGAWSPIGAVTTTMLWIEGKVTTGSLARHLFIPSMVSLLIPLALILIGVTGELDTSGKSTPKTEPGAKRVFFLGVGSLLFVPFFKWSTDLPPYMGVLAGLAVMWIVTDLIHRDADDRRFLTVAHALTRVDSSSILFFLGILLSVAGLEMAGVLRGVATSISTYIGDNPPAVTSVIGLFSAIFDNIPLVAACMKMYQPSVFPLDSSFWQMIAFCAATGGSILVIGSAAGVAFMGIERVPFTWYLRRISGPALLGYLGGIASYWLVHR